MPLHKGDLVGAYEIVAPIGQGGMATVYKAYHQRLNRYVAIKMIHQAYLQDTNFVARFEREAQIVAALEHPHIVPIFDFSEQDGEPYIVMKLIEGGTLKGILNDDLLPVDDILRILTPVGAALDYAHGRGVLHRDIKPSNIMLDKQATPYLTDFGLARLTLSGASTLSQDLMIGTPYYMSPEQATGKGEIDHRADIYSLGVVLYELFVGQVPFSEGTPYSIINDHILRELPMPRALNPDVPPLIELVLLRALAKDRDDRYQSAAELMEAIRSAVKDDAQQSSLLSQGRQSMAVSLEKQMAAAARLPEKSATPTRAAPPASATQKPKKTAPMPAKEPPKEPPKKRSYTVELTLLGIALVLVLALVIFEVVASGRRAAVVPTLAAQQPTVVIITQPPQPTVPPATRIPTEPPVTNPLPPQGNGQPSVGNGQPGGQPTLSGGQPNGQPSAGNGQPGGDPPPVPLIDVPPMTAQQAQDALARDPNNIGAYLALAKAQLQNNQDVAARRTLADAVAHFPDPAPVEMTAADTAVQIGRYDAAFVIYSQALQDAIGTRPYAAVRATAGEYLYNTATFDGRLTIPEIRQLADDLTNNTSPIVAAMIGRAFLSGNLPRLAETAVAKALAQEPNLPEAHLVNGDLKFAAGDRAGARTEWQTALSGTDAPTWVRNKATDLLNSLN